MSEEAVFTAALQIKDAAKRAAYVLAACAGDDVLRDRVLALLRSHEDGAKLLDPPHPPAEQTTLEDNPLKSDDALPFLAPSKEPGSMGRLDHYEILEIVGRGGMGVVFTARDTKLQRIVAIKALGPQLAADGTARKRFVREARAAAAVRDDHVVGIYAVHDEGPVTYLVMEFIAGTNLAAKVKKEGPLELKEILRIGMQTAEGLAAAHKQGLVHRDIKPANILLENSVQRVKIADFGLARAMNSVHLTQTGMLVGTPLYMAPEQARGLAVDHRSDLFSLGSVLYTLCTGRPAFAADNTLAVLKRVCEDKPRPIHDANPDVPKWLVAIVNKLLAKDPAGRFQSAAEVAQILGARLAKVQQPGLPTPLPIAKPIAAKRKLYAGALLSIGLLVLVGVAAVVTNRSLNMENKPIVPGPPDATHKGKSKDVASQSSATTHKDNGKVAPAQPLPDPRVLTVSQNPEHKANYATIKDALDNVEPDMTIRILDDATYDEPVLIGDPLRFSGIVLEAVGKARISNSRKREPGNQYVIWVRGVPHVTLRGLNVVSDVGNPCVSVRGYCPGTVLENLDLTADRQCSCIELANVNLKSGDEPMVIRNCKLTGLLNGIDINGANITKDSVVPLTLSRLVIRDCDFTHCGTSIRIYGDVHNVLIAGNKIFESKQSAFYVQHFLTSAKHVLIANNTLLLNRAALLIWSKGDELLQCKDIRFQNNLILGCQECDLLLFDHPKGNVPAIKPGNVNKLLKSTWFLSHNLREIDPETMAGNKECWIPACPGDQLLRKIDFRGKPGPTYLQPPKDSPLATAGVNNRYLPAYVGAIPPDGTAAWDWEVTWKAWGQLN